MTDDSLIEPRTLVAEALDCAVADVTDACGLGAHPKWDSLAHLRIMMALERHYGVPIEDDTIRAYTTFQAVAQRYRELRP